MNKLEEYKQNLLAKSRKTNADDAIESGIGIGFEAAIALDLPVKFADWKGTGEMLSEAVLLHFGHARPSNKELYQYWIENVFGILD